MKTARLALQVVCVLVALLSTARANLSDSRFETIALKNAFRLSPPKPKAPEPPPQIERPQITFQGVTTILGYAQALLQMRFDAKSIPTACVLAEGQSLNEVVVVEIRAGIGTVRLNNLGLEQTLTLDR